MTRELSFDPDDVRSVNKQVCSTKDNFSEKLQALIAKCQQHDGCWGNDEFGQSFAKNYTPAQKTMLQNGNDVVTSLTSFSSLLDRGVLFLQETDQNNANNL
ncbi:hypothetical protein SK571_45935 [Lentzea sp. BCCO 10_0798]|uniref:WXG100 family type VII secretion target n=1 Tax=Lentzea kristufekii TaxID=3095430 RepID=A0ABU4U827_9PSEU|nr:hypothetical protein [Lentzea sp. BCCO 10_0798]MDX8056754.1 hypothetical protein [Lentzea sp. BCCO 10_0798]